MARPGVDENLLLSQAMFLTGVKSVLQVVVTQVQKTHQLFLVVNSVEPHQTTCKGLKKLSGLKLVKLGDQGGPIPLTFLTIKST